MEGEEALPGSAGCNASCNACNACVTPIFRHALRSKRWYIKQNYMLLRLLRLISINYAREILLHPCFSIYKSFRF